MLAGALCCAALMPLRAPYHASSPLRPSSTSGFRDCRSRVMLAAAGDGDQGARDAADGWTGGDRLFGLKSPADLVQNLLLQCAIQTQLSYYNEFKNEVRARWLESFLGHEHLKVERVSDHGGGRQVFKGVTGGLRCSWDEYLRTMLDGKPQTYEIRYKIGTADTASMLDKSALSRMRAAADAAGEAPPTWASAAASRALNPYLQKERQEEFRTFSETIVPATVARGLLAICSQIASEWELDLALIATDGATLAQACAVGEVLCCTDAYADAAPPAKRKRLIPARALTDPTHPLPAALTDSFRAAVFQWSRDDGEEPSAFRATSFDLLQRAVTRQAVLETLFELTQEVKASQGGGDDRSADVRWLRGKMELWLPRLEKPARLSLSSLFLAELLTEQPAAAAIPAGGLRMTDPAGVAARVLARREEVAAEWVHTLRVSADSRAGLLRSELQTKLVAMLAGGRAYGEVADEAAGEGEQGADGGAGKEGSSS